MPDVTGCLNIHLKTTLGWSMLKCIALCKNIEGTQAYDIKEILVYF